MAKKKKEKNPKNRGWDVFRVIKRIIKPKNGKIIFGSLVEFVTAGGILAALKRLKQSNKFDIYRAGFLSVAILCLMIASYGVYSAIYSEKSYPNVRVANINVGSKTEKEIKNILDDKISNTESKIIKFSYKDKKWELSPSDIKLSYDNKKTAEAAYSVGRGKTYFGRFWSRIEAIGTTNEVKPVYSYDEKAFTAFLDKITADVDIPENDATGVIKKNNITFVAERTGTRVEKIKLIAIVEKNFGNLDNKVINVPVATSYPNVTLGDTEDARQQVLVMLKSKLNLKWQKGSWSLSQDIFSGWIKFKSEKIAGEKNGYRLAAYLDDSEIASYLKKLSKDIDTAPKNAKLAITDGALSVTEPSVIGYAFDQAVLLPIIRDGIMAGELKDVDLSVKEVQPDVTTENFANLGIKEIIGTGATNFKGSSTARKQNVSNGARIVNGTLIKPGEEFSAVKTIGNVDASSGFVLGLVIKGTETVPEYGGGLCQVSSTLFRSALYTGLKITERTNHAYRVGYYETDGDGKFIGPGLDSTIYGPHPDLRFVNDTGNWILIQGRVEGNKLTFDFWGTKDGRTSTVSAPVISNEVPAPAAQYVNTDTLFVGQKQQLETSHPGALVIVNYSVTKDGKEINKQIFKSKFKPWGAKYLIGTKPVEVTPVIAPVQ